MTFFNLFYKEKIYYQEFLFKKILLFVVFYIYCIFNYVWGGGYVYKYVCMSSKDMDPTGAGDTGDYEPPNLGSRN